MPTFAIYTRESLIAYAPHYFVHLTQTQEGTQRAPLGAVLADHATEHSYFVVRRRHRGEKGAYKLQHGGPGRKLQRAWCSYYIVKSTDYVIARISWETGRVEELEPFNTRRDAEKALKRQHATTRRTEPSA